MIRPFWASHPLAGDPNIFGGVRMATVEERIELLHKNLAHVEAMGGEKRVEKQHAKGKLTARERLALLFDEGTFVEVNALVKSQRHNFGQERKISRAKAL